MTKSNPSSDYQIRARLLNSLGIYPEGKNSGLVACSSPRKSKNSERVVGDDACQMDETPVIIEQTLKPLEDEQSKGDDHSTTSSQTSRKIAFDTRVVVMCIPSHTEYSKRIKKSIWSNSQEIKIIFSFQANDGRKKVPSSIGMRRSVETSALLKFRAENQVPRNVEKMVQVRPKKAR